MITLCEIVVPTGKDPLSLPLAGLEKATREGVEGGLLLRAGEDLRLSVQQPTGNEMLPTSQEPGSELSLVEPQVRPQPRPTHHLQLRTSKAVPRLLTPRNWGAINVCS